MLAVVYSNGALALFMLDKDKADKVDCCTLPPAEGVHCVSWSPKGKQLVAGKTNGTLTQYKPDLKEAKTVPAPPGFSPAPPSAVSILWLSTYQFVVCFKEQNPDNRPGIWKSIISFSPQKNNCYFYRVVLGAVVQDRGDKVLKL